MKLGFWEGVAGLLRFAISPSLEQPDRLGFAGVCGVFCAMLVLRSPFIVLSGLLRNDFLPGYVGAAVSVVVVRILLAPLFEETVFRLPLRYRASRIALLSFAVSFLLLPGFGTDSHIARLALRIVVAGSISLAAYGVCRIWDQRIQDLARAYFSAYCSLLALGFAAMHLPAESTALLGVAVLANHWLSGMAYSYVRINLDFRWAYFCHAANNSISPLLTVIRVWS